jgi:hypothetical protein
MGRAQINDQPTFCCLCSDPAVAIYYLSRGCVARPDLTVQPLCAHHEKRATPLGSFELIKDLRVGQK